MTNNEKFCARLNACADPERVLAALMAIAPIIRKAKTQNEREELIKALERGGDEA